VNEQEREYFHKYSSGYALDRRSHKAFQIAVNEAQSTRASSPSYSPLENIASIDSQDFVQGLIHDKTRFSKASFDTLRDLINDRWKIWERNVKRIEYDTCLAGTLLHQAYNRERQPLYMTLLGLERERRAESTSLWRDVSLLKRDVVTANAEYSAAYRREGLLISDSYLDK